MQTVKIGWQNKCTELPGSCLLIGIKVRAYQACCFAVKTLERHMMAAHIRLHYTACQRLPKSLWQSHQLSAMYTGRQSRGLVIVSLAFLDAGAQRFRDQRRTGHRCRASISAANVM